MLRFLLDECFRFWPFKAIESLLEDKINNDLQRLIDEEATSEQQLIMHFCSLIKEVLRSKSAHAFYGSMSLKKRKQWNYKFCQNIKRYESEPLILSAYFNVFTQQPYYGMLYFFLLFEDVTEKE